MSVIDCPHTKVTELPFLGGRCFRWCHECGSIWISTSPKWKCPEYVNRLRTTQRDAQLTRRQREVLDWICAFVKSEGCSPTLSEIGDGLHIGRTSVHEHVRTLGKLGFLVRKPNKGFRLAT